MITKNDYKTAKELYQTIDEMQLELQKLKVERRKWMLKNKECQEFYDLQNKIQIIEMDLFDKMNHLIELQHIIIETLKD
jgi:hypothetical protein